MHQLVHLHQYIGLVDAAYLQAKVFMALIVSDDLIAGFKQLDHWLSPNQVGDLFRSCCSLSQDVLTILHWLVLFGSPTYN